MEIVSLENAEHYNWCGVCDGWHLLKSAALSVIQERVPAGGSETMHYHERAHQFFFVLSGSATLEVEDQRLMLGPQQGLSIPPNVPHRLLNETQEDLWFIVISSPMSHGDRIPVGQAV